MGDHHTFDQTQDIDAWRHKIDQHLDTIRVGILDLIDCGIPDDPNPKLKRPTDAQKAVTAHEKATPTSPKVTTGEPANPVAAHTIRWAHAIWRALTDVDQLVGTWTFHTAPAELPLPAPPRELQAIPDPELDNRISPRLHPKRASRLLLARVGWTDQGDNTPAGWLPQATDAIAEDWTRDPRWRTKAWSLETATHSIARRHGRQDPTRHGRCDNPHGLNPHPTDRPDVCTWCQAADTIRRCDDRYGYDCERFIVDEPRTFTCNPCQQRAYRQRRAVFSAAWGETVDG